MVGSLAATAWCQRKKLYMKTRLEEALVIGTDNSNNSHNWAQKVGAVPANYDKSRFQRRFHRGAHRKDPTLMDVFRKMIRMNRGS